MEKLLCLALSVPPDWSIAKNFYPKLALSNAEKIDGINSYRLTEGVSTIWSTDNLFNVTFV